MAKAASPAVGFNDNVRRRNRNFHVQTEDSGVAHPHIITHLFTDGGRIVKSMRQSYAEIVAEENLAKQVRERMKAQHTGMLEALKRGEFDALVWGSRSKPALPAAAKEPAPVAPPPVSDDAVSSGVLPSRSPAPAPARLPPPPRRASTPPPSMRVKPPQPSARKTMPRIDTSAVAQVNVEPEPAPLAAVAASPVRARKTNTPPKRRTSHPPPISATTPPSSRSREGLVSQTLDEVILLMLSEEAETRSG